MKINAFIFSIAAVTLLSCNSSNKKNNGGTDTQESATESAVELFKYVEPQEDIAKIIWEKLLATYPEIQNNVAEAKKWKAETEYNNELSEKEDYQSKTRVKFCNVLYGAEASFDGLAYYLMQCYRMKDNTWTAVLFSITDYKDGEFRSFNYKDGNLTENTESVQIPEYQTKPFGRTSGYRDCRIDFDSIGFTMINKTFWPIRYNWTGEKFVTAPNAVIISDQIDKYGSVGGFQLNHTIDYNINYAAPWGKVENNILCDKATGEQFLQFETEDGKITAINILSPKIGFGETYESCATTYCDYDMHRITSKPVAIGFPIKNVLDYDKGNDFKDKNITIETKDGYYTVNQLLNRDKDDKRDILIAFYAKDANSNIEKIRYYTAPLVITLESELAENSNMPQNVKEICTKLITEQKITAGMGAFHNCYISRNGFTAKYFDNGTYTPSDKNSTPEWEIKCYMFKNIDGSYRIVTQKQIENRYLIANGYDEKLFREFAQYTYSNGSLKQTEVEIPQSIATDYPAGQNDNNIIPAGKNNVKSDPSTLISSIPLDDYSSCSPYITLMDDGFCLRAGTTRFEHYGEFEDSPAAEVYYTAYYDWDGEQFVERIQKLNKYKALALEIYSKIPDSDLHYDYKGITENDIATESDYEGKRLSQNNLGFTNYWGRKTKMIFTAQRTVSGYDVYYYTQTSPDAQPQFLKYNYANGTLTKTSITQNEIDELKNEWRYVF